MTSFIKNYTSWKKVFEAAESMDIIMSLSDEANKAADEPSALEATSSLKDWIQSNMDSLADAVSKPDSLIKVIEALEPWYDAHHESLRKEEIGAGFAEKQDKGERQKLGIADDEDLTITDDDVMGMDIDDDIF